MPRYDALLIDMDLTLFDFGKAADAAFERACLAHDIPHSIPLRTLCSEISEECWRLYERNEYDLDTLNHIRFAKFYDAIGKAGDSDAFGRCYLSHIGESGALMPGAEVLVKTVAPAMPIIIITNGDGSGQRSRLAKSAIKDHITDILVSGETGAAKPDPLMLRMGMARAGVTDPSRAIMVGDMIITDVMAAKAAGVASCWYNYKRLPAPADVQPDFIIHSFEELPCVLGLV
jgi:FMN phosphatase YigB (HAD superfamily)